MYRPPAAAIALVLGLASATEADQTTLARVFVFTTTDCPIANRYAPEIKRLANRFQSNGVRFSLVFPVPTDSLETVRQHLAVFGYEIPFIRDSKLEFVRRTGVTVTPEVAVEDAHGRIVYRGRIDNRYVDFGKDRLLPTSRDLENALDAIVAGKPVPMRETRAVGCLLSDLVK